MACRNGLPTTAGIPYTYRLDGSLFNLRRLKAETKVSNDWIYELQYADDAAIPAHSAADLQSSLDILSTAYRRAGLLDLQEVVPSVGCLQRVFLYGRDNATEFSSAVLRALSSYCLPRYYFACKTATLHTA